MGITRKLEGIRRDLALLAGQGKVEGFLKNVGNADKLRGLLEDIRDAIVEYQVCISFNRLPLHGLTFELDFVATRSL